MSYAQSSSDEAGRVEEAVKSLTSRMENFQDWAELSMENDKSIGMLSLL